jgi:hypothetical protein
VRVTAPRIDQDQVERKANQLHGFATAEGLSLTHLRLGAIEVQRRNLPLRDAPVLREARRLADLASPAAAASWESALARIRLCVPGSTFNIWLEPVTVLGGEEPTLHLLAPDGIASWLKRRYLPLIREALKGTGSAYTDLEFVSMGEGETCR